MNPPSGPPIPPEHRPIICRVMDLMLEWVAEQQALTEPSNKKGPAPGEALDPPTETVPQPRL